MMYCAIRAVCLPPPDSTGSHHAATRPQPRVCRPLNNTALYAAVRAADAVACIAHPILLHPVVDGLGPAGTLVAMSSTDVSAKLFADACALIPGGVNSP